LAWLDRFDNDITGSGYRKHSEIMFEGIFMGSNTGSSTAVLESIYFVSMFIGSPHGRFHTAIGQESTQHNIANFSLSQKKIKIGWIKTTEPRFTLYHLITLCGI
jgi:hypothetical protein